MKLDKDIASALAFQREHPGPGIRSMSIAEARSAYDEAALLFDPHPPEMARIDELAVPGADGKLEARLFVPRDETAEPGLIVWLHGGGWFQGSQRSHECACRRLASASRNRVLAVDYRLAPEHPFPAALDDAASIYRWAHANADQLGAFPGRLALGGDSAGATLALVAGLDAAREGLPPALVALCYPSLGPEIRSDSRHELAEGFGLSADDMDYCFELYLSADADHADPRISPLLTPDLHEAPPTLVAVAGFDLLRDEGLALVGLLEGSGVEVELHDETSLIHGFLRLGGISAGAATATQRFGESILASLQGESDG